MNVSSDLRAQSTSSDRAVKMLGIREYITKVN